LICIYVVINYQATGVRRRKISLISMGNYVTLYWRWYVHTHI